MYIAITHTSVIDRVKLFCSSILSQAEEYSSAYETKFLSIIWYSCYPVGIGPFIMTPKKRARLGTFTHMSNLIGRNKELLPSEPWGMGYC